MLQLQDDQTSICSACFLSTLFQSLPTLNEHSLCNKKLWHEKQKQLITHSAKTTLILQGYKASLAILRVLFSTYISQNTKLNSCFDMFLIKAEEDRICNRWHIGICIRWQI